MVRKGTKLVALKDFSVTALVHWHAPMTSDLRCMIPKGTVLIASANPVPLLGSLQCIPADNQAFQRQHVPEGILTDSRFAGISFVFSRREVEDNLRELSSGT